MAIQASGWMLGVFPLAEPALPVERIGETHPQVYPQKDRFLIQSTSWRLQKAPSIYGGVALWIFEGDPKLLHSRDHLSTDYRDLSTNWSATGRQWGIPLPPTCRRYFVRIIENLENQGI